MSAADTLGRRHSQLIPREPHGDRNFLFGVSPFDLGIFAGVTGMLLGAAVVASFVPALRSARVDPNVALRLE